MKKQTNEIRCIHHVPDGNGGYRTLDELTAEERSAWARSRAERMGEAVNAYYSAHPDEIGAFVASVGA